MSSQTPLSAKQPPPPENLARASELYCQAQALSLHAKPLNRRTARALIEIAGDAIKAFGDTNLDKRIELEEIIDEATKAVPPKGFKELYSRAENYVVEKIFPKNPILRVMLLMAALSAVLVPSGLAAWQYLSQWQPAKHTRTITGEIQLYGNVPWEKLIEGAEDQVLAVGTKITPLESSIVEELTKKVINKKTFKVTLVLMNPDSERLRQRIEDEQVRYFQSLKREITQVEKDAKTNEILQDVQRDINNRLSMLNKALIRLGTNNYRMIVKCSEAYPTIAVIIIDGDLYTYSYPHGETASESPVLIFRNYKKDFRIVDLAAFYERHLETTVSTATEVENGKCKL